MTRCNGTVGQRREQAQYNAAIASLILEDDPQAWVVVGGDLNVFPRPDEPVYGEPTDQLGPLYDAGLHNMYDRWYADNPAAAYTYVYKGQAGTFDQFFLSDDLNNHVAQTWVAHVNADWPDTDADDGARGASDHDPAVVAFNWTGTDAAAEDAVADDN